MATQSIRKNIVINDPKAAEVFISAMEKAAEAAENQAPYHVEYDQVKGEDLKRFLGAFVK